jgi:hypothetical protein
LLLAYSAIEEFEVENMQDRKEMEEQMSAFARIEIWAHRSKAQEML